MSGSSERGKGESERASEGERARGREGERARGREGETGRRRRRKTLSTDLPTAQARGREAGARSCARTPFTPLLEW